MSDCIMIPERVSRNERLRLLRTASLEEIFTGNQRDAGASAEGARSRDREIAHSINVTLDPSINVK